MWVIWACLATPKTIVSIWRNLWCLSGSKKPTSFFPFSLRYFLVENFRIYLQAKKHLHTPCFSRYIPETQTSYFRYFVHAWLRTLKIIISNRRKFFCFSACQKQTSSITSSLRYYILKNPMARLVNSISAHNPRTRILPEMQLVVKYQ